PPAPGEVWVWPVGWPVDPEPSPPLRRVALPSPVRIGAAVGWTGPGVGALEGARAGVATLDGSADGALARVVAVAAGAVSGGVVESVTVVDPAGFLRKKYHPAPAARPTNSRPASPRAIKRPAPAPDLRGASEAAGRAARGGAGDGAAARGAGGGGTSWVGGGAVTRVGGAAPPMAVGDELRVKGVARVGGPPGGGVFPGAVGVSAWRTVGVEPARVRARRSSASSRPV